MKKIILISFIVLICGLAAFFFPKNSGSGGSAMDSANRVCQCLGFEKIPKTIGQWKNTCFGIPYSCTILQANSNIAPIEESVHDEEIEAAQAPANAVLSISEAIGAHRAMEDYSVNWRTRIPDYELMKGTYKEDIGYSSAWLSYQNPEKGFQFEYPSDYYLKKTGDPLVALHYGGFTKTFYSEYSFDVFVEKPVTVNADEIVRNVSESQEQAQEVLEKMRAREQADSAAPTTYQKLILIDGKGSLLSSKVSGRMLTWVISFPPETGIDYVLNLSGPVGIPATLEIFERFLSSFKFTITSSEEQMKNTEIPQVYQETDVEKRARVGWKKYINTKHEYFFEYPGDWKWGDDPGSITPIPAADHVAFDSPQYTALRFVVDVSAPAGCSSLMACVEDHRIGFSFDQTSTGLVTAVVGGNDALKETITRPVSGNWKYYVYYLYQDNKLYTLSTTSRISDDAQTAVILDQIVSTFELGKPSRSLEAMNESLDSDQDGLTDAQEKNYKTDPYARDSDGDGYADRDELASGYNPSGPGAYNDPHLIIEDIGSCMIQPDADGKRSRLISIDGESNILQSDIAYLCPANQRIEVIITDAEAVDIMVREKDASIEHVSLYKNNVYLIDGHEYTWEYGSKVFVVSQKERPDGDAGLVLERYLQNFPPDRSLPFSVTEDSPQKRDQIRVSDIKQIQTALELYYADSNHYPLSFQFQTPFTNDDGAVIMQKVPNDPSYPQHEYQFESRENSASYVLRFTLEEGVGGLAQGPHEGNPQGIR